MSVTIKKIALRILGKCAFNTNTQDALKIKEVLVYTKIIKTPIYI